MILINYQIIIIILFKIRKINNTKNIKRIKKIINQIKLRVKVHKDSLKINRIGPYVSASFYYENDIKLGNDNNFWKISHGKWIKINDKIIIKKILINIENKYINIIKKIPQIGEINNSLLFIKNYSFNNKKNINIEFIGNEIMITKLLTKIKFITQ